MATSYFRLEQTGAKAEAELAGIAGAVVLRVDRRKDKTTIYFSADKRDPASKQLRARASEVKLADVTKL